MNKWILTLSLALTNLGQADYTIKQTVEDLGQREQVTIKLHQDKCRIDSSPETSTIVDSKNPDTVVLMHPQKMFLKLSQEQLEAKAEAVKKMLSEDTSPDSTTEFQSNGKQDTINGFPTEEFTGKIGGLNVILAIDKTFPNYKNVLTALHEVENTPALSIFRSVSTSAEKYPGMPIRTTIEILGQKVITTLDSFDEKPIDPAEFAIPADYKELKPNVSPSPAPAVSPRP